MGAIAAAVFVWPRMVTFEYEWNRLQRQISIGAGFDSPALGEGWWKFGQMQGHATSQWRGETLDVVTDNFLESKLLEAFLPSSDQLKLREQIRLTGPDTLEDRITIEDPAYCTKPWDAVLTFKRQPEAMFPFAEDVCLDRLKAGQPPIER